MADTSMTRSEIRYALFRCRSGNPDAEHREIYSGYATELSTHGLSIADFPQTWDVGMEDPTVIISGILLTPLKAKVDGSLFDDDGNLKEG